MSDKVVNMGASTPEEFVNILDGMHRSKGYEEIRNMTPQMLRDIRNDTALYQKYQDIKAECKKSYEYDHKVATMYDVNRGLTNLYNIILQLMKANKNDTDAALDSICSAINKIEEKLGIDKTDWNGGNSDATSNTGNVESITSSDK